MILLENFVVRELQVFIEIIFRGFFEFSILILKKSSRMYLIFSRFSAVFEKSGNISRQEVSFSYILRVGFFSEDLQIVNKKADTVLIRIYVSRKAIL